MHEGETVTFTKDEVAEYDKDYFNALFETVGVEEVEPTEETVEETAEPTPKKRGKKAEETAE